MSREIRWTPEAELTFRRIVTYLEEKWSEREVRKFMRTINKTLKRISQFPYLFESSSSNPTVRKGYLTKQCSLFYEVYDNEIVLLFFWDNRRKPSSRE